MILHMCESGPEAAGGPGPFAHPCAANAVPILVLDDGEAVTGSGSIVRWAADHSRAS